MGFRRASGKPCLVWFPVDGTDTLYRGQLVKSSGAGVVPLGAASGADDATGDSLIVGIVVGDDQKKPTYDSTYKTDYVTAVTSQASLAARDTSQFSAGHMWPVGDKITRVLVDVIDPCTWIRGPIFVGAYGTAPTVLTATAGSTDGGITAFTTNACDFTPVANMCTIYCRSGANAGSYRITNDTSTTAPSVTHAFMEDIAVGDTFVRVPLRLGRSYMQTQATESMYINGAASPATNYWNIFVRELNLSVAGDEHAIFRFTHIEHTFA